ncbi:outer membrane lipoprotein carrier protein LolA [Azohydromonas lata]|uniref:Outer membrane lipoprotein carrier protein LolA n=1 Tax=Azohydromonas lata TaxID=45677 RepID=A0ABU5IKM7_9BURK|nr:outer membrane lipoprotein carrier protein LolA [Azohydromonas lata]MDZ5459468.1 outer membrane lipoprotein carrier protein LolA [Azohydromonas lata]
MLALALALMAAARPGAAQPLPPIVAQVRERLVQAPVLRGEFEQRKTVKGFKNPLLSRGDFIVARERGVLWHTREPFASTLTLTRERLLSRAADGSVAMRLDAREEPGARAVNELLFALMAADLPTLAQRFRVEGELQGAEGWRLQLTPRDAALAQWVGRIEIEGDRHVRVVRLSEAQGDATAIRFSALATAASLTREEAVRFE